MIIFRYYVMQLVMIPILLLLCFNGLTMIYLRDARLLCIMTQNIKKEGSEHPT